MKTLKCGAALLALMLMIFSSPAWAQNSAGPASAPQSGGTVSQSELTAAPPVAAPASPRPGSALASTGFSSSLTDMGWAVGAFVLVLVLLYFSLKGLSRLGRFRGGRGRSVFELKGIQALDSRNYLAAVEVEGRLLVVGVSQDRITPVAQWYLEEGESGLDFAEAKLPADEPVLDIKLPGEEEDLPLDISIADSQKRSRQ